MDCVKSTIQLQSIGLQKIVPALPVFGLDRVVILDRLQSDMNSGTISHGLGVIRGFPRILLQFFQIPGNPLRFCNLVAIQMDRTGSRMDCLESTIRPQSTGLQKSVLALPWFWQSLRNSF
jgi:hypothetical protein